MRCVRILYSAVIYITLIVGAVSAQTTEFTYQGSLKDGVNLANGNYDFEFLLFDALSSGAQVGSTLTRSPVAVSSGIFTVSLDFGSEFPGASRFLEIRVRPTGGGSFNTLSPRQQIDTAPYSVKSLNTDSATNAAQLGGVAASQYVVTTDPRMTDSRSPTAGSGSYIQNQNAVTQSSSNFSIDGTGSANIFNAATQFNLGANRLVSNAGTDNLFVGINAGAVNTSGNNNSFFGKDAGASNTVASSNSFFGSNSGKNNSVGVSNSFFGMHTGLQNTNGVQNSFFGALSGTATTTGGMNSFFGMSAGAANTTGTENTIIGALSNVLSNNLTNASAIGSKAAVSQSNSLVLGGIVGVNGATADTSVGIGTTAPSAVLHVTGSQPPLTVFGNGTSASPVLRVIGAKGGYSGDTFPITTGGNGSNVVIQAGDGGDAPNGYGGNGGSVTLQAGVGGSTTLGPGPAGSINLIGRGRFQQGVGSIGSANSAGFWLFQNTPGDRAFVGMESDNNVGLYGNGGAGWSLIMNTQTGNIGIGTTSPQQKLHVDGDEVLSTGSGSGFKFRDRGSTSSADDWVWYSMGNIARFFRAGFGDILTFSNSGVVGINVLGSAGATALCRNASNQISTCSSSLRYKTNVAGFSSGLSFVNRLRPISFEWKDGGIKDVGFGAEDIAKIDPRFVTYNDKGEVEGVKYDRLSVAFVNAFKEQQEQIEKQQNEINELRQIVCQLKPDAKGCTGK